MQNMKVPSDLNAYFNSRRLKNLLINSSLNKALIQAAISGSLEDVELLLENGANPNSSINDYFTFNTSPNCSLLYLISQKGYYPISKLLLAAGAKTHVEKGENSDPLLFAFQNSQIIAKNLIIKLEQNPDINQILDGEKNTPLILAIKLGQYDLAASFIERGAHFFLEDIYGNDAFDLSPSGVRAKLDDAIRRNGELDFLKRLSSSEELYKNSLWDSALKTSVKGSTKDIKKLLASSCYLEEKGVYGNTPLLAAAGDTNKFEVMLILIKAGANIEAVNERKETLKQIMNKLRKKNKKIRLTNTVNDMLKIKNEHKILSFAVSEGYYDLAKFGISKGEDINQRTGEDENSLLMAAIKKGHLFIAKLLIDNKANITLKNKEGITVMEMCKEMKVSDERMQALFGENCKIDDEELFENKKQDNYQPEFFSNTETLKNCHLNLSNPIFSVIAQKDFNKLQLIIQHGNDVNIHAHGGGKTPLHLAVELEQEAMVVLLLEAKASINAITKTGTTALHVAAQKGNTSIIEILLNAGAKIDMASAVGCTPLHEAAAAGHKNAVIMLLNRGADTNLKDYRFNLTAYQLACFYDMKNVISIFDEQAKTVTEGKPLQNYSGTLIKSSIKDKLKDTNVVFFESEINPSILKKYELADDMQVSLEKGLRNAAANNQDEDLKVFIKYVKNLDAKDSNPKMQRTALHWAAINGHSECYKLLSYAGANAKILDASGKTALEYNLRSSLESSLAKNSV